MKKILLSVTGLTPQVVTETLYALYKKNETPDCVFLITTGRGKNRAMRDLLDEKDGRFHEFCECYGLKNICFSEKNILVITDKHGALLDDIRTPADNDAAADFIMAKVREFCAQPAARAWAFLLDMPCPYSEESRISSRMYWHQSHLKITVIFITRL